MENLIFLLYIIRLSSSTIYGFLVPTTIHGGKHKSFRNYHCLTKKLSSSTFIKTSQPSQMQTYLCQSTSITDIIEKESFAQYNELIEYAAYDKSMEPSDNEYRPHDILYFDTPEDISSYVDEQFDHILFDCDGVLYRGKDPIPGAALAIRSLMDRGKRCLFVTNNAGINRRELRDKLVSVLHDFDRDMFLEEDQMVCSGYSAAKYLQGIFAGRQGGGDSEDVTCSPNIYAIGTSGLCDELRAMGFIVSGGPSLSSDEKASMSRDELASYSFVEEEKGGQIDAVVVGLDTEFNYRKLCIANVLLQRHPDALLIATNEDAFDLVGGDARHLPGNGALVKALEHASQRKAINVGKPSKILVDLLVKEHGIDPQRTLMVGDRLDTDVRFGRDGGMQTALVLTGCTTASQLKGFTGTEEEPLPHTIFPHMGMMGT